MLGLIHIGGVKRCEYVALRVGRGINEVVMGRLSGSEEWSGGIGGGSRTDGCCFAKLILYLR